MFETEKIRYSIARAPDKDAWPNPPTDQMCFVNLNMARSNQMQDHVLLNIQIVRCKPDEICDPAKESQYLGHDLGYVFFIMLVILMSH